MSEPIEESGDLHEAEKGRGKFVVARADAAVAFDAAEEIFDLMTMPIVTAVKCDRATSRAFWWNTYPRALSAEPRAKRVGIEALVSDSTVPTQARQQRVDCIQIVARPGRQTERHRTPMAVHHRGQLGVDAALGAFDGLCTLARVD